MKRCNPVKLRTESRDTLVLVAIFESLLVPPHYRDNGPLVHGEPVADEGVGDDGDGAGDTGRDADVRLELLLPSEVGY